MNPAIDIQTGSDGVVVLTLDRPASRNAIDDEMATAIVDVCAMLEADMEVRCVVLAANGPSFCAGGNVKEMVAAKGMFGGSPVEMRRGYRAGIQRVPLAMYNLEVPVIAAVNGPVIGAGFDLTLMCDLRIASTAAQFAESFVRLGLISGDGGAWFLPRAIGMARASHMTLTGDVLDARTALDWGLVSEVVEPEQLLPRALDTARKIASHPPHSVRLNKRLLREAAGMTLPQTLELSGCLQSLVQHTSDHREALQAFVGKRPAVYKAK